MRRSCLLLHSNPWTPKRFGGTRYEYKGNAVEAPGEAKLDIPGSSASESKAAAYRQAHDSIKSQDLAWAAENKKRFDAWHSSLSPWGKLKHRLRKHVFGSKGMIDEADTRGGAPAVRPSDDVRRT
ncbi:hypothetical protein DIPPA_22511 [Diplonema papillatum]|nr:hypothetical protein DIPPA_22511 [Diplonema papillatum]